MTNKLQNKTTTALSLDISHSVVLQLLNTFNEEHKQEQKQTAQHTTYMTRVNPRDNLTHTQNDVLNEFILQLSKENLTPQQKAFCDEACLLRYLRARDWELKKSFKMLQATLKWREEYKPELIFAEDLAHTAETGKLFRRGFDKQGRPIVYVTPARENSKDYDKNMQLLVYCFERAIEACPDGVEQMTWILDFNDYSTKNAPPFAICKETLNILSNHYPERLGLALIVDAPWIFNMFYKAITPFINPATKAKVAFVKGDDEKKKVLSKHVDLTEMERRFGGSSDFNFDASFWKSEIEADAERRKRLGLTASVVRKPAFTNVGGEEEQGSSFVDNSSEPVEIAAL